MFFLVPTLFLSCGIALLLWAWAAGTFLAGRWVYERLPFSFDGDGKVVSTKGGKKIIFEKKDTNGAGAGVDIKAEAAEVKE